MSMRVRSRREWPTDINSDSLPASLTESERAMCVKLFINACAQLAPEDAVLVLGAVTNANKGRAGEGVKVK